MKKESFVERYSNLWFFGTLLKVDRPTYAGAFYEFLYLVIWSVLPFGLGALVLYVTTDSETKNFLQFSIATFRNGELLVFSISMLAPILYLTLHDPDGASRFPHRLPISTIVTLVIVMSAALFALLKASAVKDSEFVYQFSVALTCVALTFRFLSLIYHRYRLKSPTELEMRAPEVEFVKDFRHHIEQQLGADQQDFVNKFESHLGEQK
jgi:hypothetical protein